MKKPNEKERLEVYKTVLDILINNKVAYGMGDKNDSIGLCMLLMCAYTNTDWDSVKWDNVYSYFTEFSKHYPIRKNNKLYAIYEENRHEWRIKVLEEIISEMEAK